MTRLGRKRNGSRPDERLTQPGDGFAAALLSLAVDPGVVVALVAGDRLGPEAASVYGVTTLGRLYRNAFVKPTRLVGSPGAS